MVAFAVVAAWVLWLARQSELAESAAPPVTQAAQSTARQDGLPLHKDSTSSPLGSLNQPAAAVTTPQTPSPSEPAIQAPASATVGEGFDVRVSLEARVPVRRVAVKIAYDHALLRARTVEEIDYTRRGLAERAFRTEQASDGQLEVVLGDVPANERPMSAPLIQFEALASGRTQIRVTRITVLDSRNRSLTWSATGQESEVLIR